MPDATASEGASEQRQVATQVAKSPKSHPQAATPTQHLSKSPSRGQSPSPERANSHRLESNRTSPSSTSDSTPSTGVADVQGGVTPGGPGPTGTSLASIPGTGSVQKINKIRRVFTIIRNFCVDVSPSAGEVATKFICSLVCATISLEEFRCRVAELTGLHLKAFVVPFLRANLPVLQTQLLALAKAAKQSSLEYLSTHEHFLIDGGTSGEPLEIFEQLPPRKRMYTEIQRTTNAEPGNKRTRGGEPEEDPFDARHSEEALQNVNQMLDCILAMVDKTKKTLSLLRKRQDPLWNIRMPLELELKRRIIPNPLPHYDIGLLDVRRRTEEAVQEVRRQAMLELEKAVTAAESRASQMIALERSKLETLILEAKRQAQQEVLTRLNKHHHQSPEPPGSNDAMLNCWNCGRKANDTCSGCGLARYCGAFCQHRHWESHHKVCKALHLSRAPQPPIASSGTNSASDINNLGNLCSISEIGNSLASLPNLATTALPSALPAVPSLPATLPTDSTSDALRALKEERSE
ncbi:protein CBFA2T3-like [Varroa destructor]|uniref:Protein CBFA2T3 n=1 Tax=Varroa destructor TaxID=109461 RepID=A0A7M7JCA0_VARDE|nr:protein CBFA2T3-like [Varroa destructor]XP_022649938.1 protein CBFA2T3-like [Varroa destructor]